MKRYSSILREAIGRGAYKQSDLEPVLSDIRAQLFLGTSRFNHVDPDWEDPKALEEYFTTLLADVSKVEKAELHRNQQNSLLGT